MSELWARLLEEFDAPVDEYGRRIPRPSAPDAVTRWPPPRGARAADGNWEWSLASRPGGTYVNLFERRSVEIYRELASTLVSARKRQSLALRQLSSITGVALSVLTGLENGSAWPHFETLAMVADAMDHRIQVAGPRAEISDEARVNPTEVEAAWLAAGYPAAVPWQILITDELRHRMLGAGVSKTAVARTVGLRHNTVTDIYNFDGYFRFVSVRTLCALSATLGARLEAVRSNSAWG